MALSIFFLFAYTFTTASMPVSYYTFSNPAFTAHPGDYQVTIEPKDVGDIAVFNCAARFGHWGFGFSNMRAAYERKNWGSIAHHLDVIPLSLGFNIGVNKTYETDVLFDLGAWFRRTLNVGVCFGNTFDDEKILRLGAAYKWKKITGTFELEDSLAHAYIIPHFLLSFDQPIGDFSLKLMGGFHAIVHGNDVGRFVGGFEIGFREFINVQLFLEEETKFLLEVNFSPPVIVREVSVVETLLVDRPVVVKKTVKKTVPKHKAPVGISKTDRDYCEKHYLKGIEYYLNNQLEAAIDEWKLVVKRCSDYKDTQRYLENAKEKLKLLKEADEIP